MSDGLEPSPKQLHSIKDSTASINLWEGSVRSGKTIASLMRFLLYIANSTVRGELVVISRTRGSAARNVFAPLMDPTMFGEWSQYVSYTPGAEAATILGRKVWVLGSSDVRSENTLRGLTCAGAYVDEATLLQEDFFTQLLNRRWEGAKIFATTNPDNPAHWLKVKFIDRWNSGELPDWKVWKFFLDDNPALSEARKEGIRRENTGLYYRRNVLGEWVAAEGAVYDMWDPARHVVKWDDLPPMRRMLAIAIDYGTQHATSAVALCLGYDRKLYLVDELRLDPKVMKERLTDAKQSARIKEWLPQQHAPEATGMRPEYVIADQAGASLRSQLLEDGINTMGADKDVKYGISLIASLLGSGQLLVSDHCQGVIAEAPGYSWDDKKALLGKDEPVKSNDDSLDAMRYAICTTESLWREELAPTAVSF
ncbi:PBSX family phage terminase large subunit [Subtercola endophyticus]|uniref:PBSX family phage terminase large subunit n=1 Tax=Subtercola endophyticus TaxID=2895559 RepID=UPI001E2B0AAC|nr:PBSX family phage terminase large subunit [Subtercola endophyticus]UFS59485.1 PBSX family phage terminase large subunit [Subtercola endophyticus]